MCVPIITLLFYYHVSNNEYFCVENDIDISNLFELDGSSIRELIPSVGKRMKFIKLLNNAKELRTCNVQVNNKAMLLAKLTLTRLSSYRLKTKLILVKFLSIPKM